MFITAWGLLTMVMATFARKYPGGELVLPPYIRYANLRKSLIHYTYTANVCAACDARVVGEEMDCDYTGQRSESTLLTSCVPDIEKFQNASKIDS